MWTTQTVAALITARTTPKASVDYPKGLEPTLDYPKGLEPTVDYPKGFEPTSDYP